MDEESDAADRLLCKQSPALLVKDYPFYFNYPRKGHKT